MRATLLVSILALVACGSPLVGGSARDPMLVLTGLDATHTFEVRVDGAEDVGGYLVEFYRGSEGTTDERDFPAGTVLVQGPDLGAVGFITPGGACYRFDDQARSVTVDARGRHAQIAALLGLEGRLIIRSALPGVPLPPEAGGEPG